MSNDVQKYLADPNPGITLDELARELNELGGIRDSARLAFCKRLAVAYLMVVGHRPIKGGHDGKKFYDWCERKIRSGNGKTYKINSLKASLRVGFASNPEKALSKIVDASKYSQRNLRNVEGGHTVASAIKRAVTTENPPKPATVTKLRSQFKLPTDVAREVNQLMTAWEQASSQARSQFMYMITGKRIAA
jgi:hypothetical protein